MKEIGWIGASELLPGDEIFTSNGGWLRVSGGTWLSKRQTVYNFEVENYHTYFVGLSGAWVHNDCNDVAADYAKHDRLAQEYRASQYTEGAKTPIKFKGDRVYALQPSKGGSGPNRWHRMNPKGRNGSTNNYKQRYTSAKGSNIEADAQIHHSYPQEYRSTAVANNYDIDAPSDLFAVKATPGPNTNLHSKITVEFTKWDKKFRQRFGRAPNHQEILQKKRQMDKKWGRFYDRHLNE